MFRMHLLDTQPVGPVAKVFNFIKKLPRNIQTPFLVMCHLPLGAMKKTRIFEEGKLVYKSLTQHEFWKTGWIYLPAMLHHKKKLGVLDQFKRALIATCTRVLSEVKRISLNMSELRKIAETVILDFQTIIAVGRLKSPYSQSDPGGKSCPSKSREGNSRNLQRPSLELEVGAFEVAGLR